MRKPTKTISGVTPIAVVIKPQKCPHGTCIYCPSLNVPQSYTPKSPAIIRARNLSYDPYKQVLSRLSAFQAMKHPTDKIELIIMGGTFLSYPIKYQYEFVLNCYNALNSSDKSEELHSVKFQSSSHNSKMERLEKQDINCHLVKCSSFNNEYQSVSDSEDMEQIDSQDNNCNLSQCSINNSKGQSFSNSKKVRQPELQDINCNLSQKFTKPGKEFNPHYNIAKCSSTLNSNNLSLASLKKSLDKAKKLNETANHRCIALCIETRPDFCSDEDIKRMLEFGCTRVELGVQMPSDILYKKTKRGHSVKDVIQATERLKNAGFKVSYHIMPGLPFSNIKTDIKFFKKLFSSQDFKPDQLKIYPCQVIQGAELEKLYYQGKYKPYNEKQLIQLITKFKQFVPKYCRIMRIMREIPPEYMVAGTKRIDLRKVISEEMKKQGKKCNCIRCREIGFMIRDKQKISKKIKLNVVRYEASHGQEYFLEVINEDNIIFALIRLRVAHNSKTLLVRELHVYGQAVEIGEIAKEKETQHTGLGKWLMNEAEKIAKKEKCCQVKVISGVGVREYYKNLGYKIEKEYMVKSL